MVVLGHRRQGLVFAVWDMLKAQGSEGTRHLISTACLQPPHHHPIISGGGVEVEVKGRRKCKEVQEMANYRLGTGQAPGPAQELCSSCIQSQYGLSSHHRGHQGGQSCQRGYNAYLITLTRSWKALSTLRGGSLALVSIYGIWKAKCILVNLAP